MEKSSQTIQSSRGGDEAPKPPLIRKASIADIEGLLAEGRAAAEAERTNGHSNFVGPPAASSKQTSKASNNKNTNSTTPIVSEMSGTQDRRTNNASVESQQSSQNSKGSSELSEQGEIRDDSNDRPVPSSTVGISSKDKPGIISLDRGRGPQKYGTEKPESCSSCKREFKSAEALDKHIAEEHKSQQVDGQAKPKENGGAGPHISRESSRRREEPSRPDTRTLPRSTRSHIDDRFERFSDRRDRKPYEYSRDSTRSRQYDAPRKMSTASEVEKGQLVHKENASKGAPRGLERHESNVDIISKTIRRASDTGILHESPLPLPVVQKPTVANEDVHDWLLLTGYYDQTYRDKTLQRHRRLAVIEKEREELLREEQQDNEARAQSDVRGTPFTSFSPHLVRATSVLAMPPPALTTPKVDKDLGLRIKDSALKNESATVSVETSPLEAHPSESSMLKRRYSGDSQPPEKLARISTAGHADVGINRAAEVLPDAMKSRPTSPRAPRRRSRSQSQPHRPQRYGETGISPVRQGFSHRNLSPPRHHGQWSPHGFPHSDSRESEEWRDSSRYRSHGGGYGSGRGRGGYYGSGGRGGSRGVFHKREYSDGRAGSDVLDLRSGGRYY